jgi:hypothetical protein
MYFLILTFDVEDFMNDASTRALVVILKLLRKYDLRSLFFVTGNMAERLGKYPDILRLLDSHEIGYHSSSHSVRPIIPEFTDVESYSKAIEMSLIRETSHINPLTGELEGEGGIRILKETFDNKNIVSFRAPGFCWTPPHLEALQKLGIKFDFSARLYGKGLLRDQKVAFRGIVFYPFPKYLEFWVNPMHLTSLLSSEPSGQRLLCLSSHEWSLAVSEPWDLIYYRSNPTSHPRKVANSSFRSIDRLLRFDVSLRGIKMLERLGALSVTSTLDEQASTQLEASTVNVAETYRFSMRWATHYFNYNPKYVLSHFLRYFDQTASNREVETCDNIPKE